MDLVQAWERQTYSLALSDGPEARVSVDGIAMKEVPWIGLHVGSTASIDVTHIPSGKRIGGFASLGSALEFAARIAYLLDWRVIAPDLSAPSVCAIEEARRLVTAPSTPSRTV